MSKVTGFSVVVKLFKLFIIMSIAIRTALTPLAVSTLVYILLNIDSSYAWCMVGVYGVVFLVVLNYIPLFARDALDKEIESILKGSSTR